MSIRELKHPKWELVDHAEGFCLWFRVPYSRFGAVEVIFSLDEARQFGEALADAVSADLQEGQR